MTRKQTKYMFNPRAACRMTGDGAVILDLDTGLYWTLNKVGAKMWKLLGEGTEIDRITETLSHEHKTGKTRIQKDLNGLIERLKKANLLTLKS